MSYRFGFRESDSSRVVTNAVDRRRAFERAIGTSKAFDAAITAASELTGRRMTSLLLVGEPGTGKELIARAIHSAGPRSGQLFVQLDCADLSEDLLESELFGHEPGALPEASTLKRGMLEVAGDGTLLLKHVDRLPAALQPKLLRVLEDRRAYRVGGTEEFRVGCSIVATSGEELQQAAEAARFRGDLFERLSRERIVLPALCERGADAVLLAEHFIQEMARDEGLLPLPLSEDVAAALQSHPWPGNVRELRTAIRSALTRATGPQIEVEDLLMNQRRSVRADRAMHAELGAISIPTDGISLKRIEAEAIRLTLGLAGNNRTAAARILGISRPTLIRKIRDYDLVAGAVGGPA